ncbi:MAG: N-acetyl-gamma-glutamyl-phosphate reductase [Actinomycetota bacterium]
MIRASIVGASGFAGGELLRLLVAHPEIKVVAAGASSQAGKPVSSVFPGLNSCPDESFATLDQAWTAEADLVFVSLPQGESSRLPAEHSGRVIDLAGDFRLNEPANFADWHGSPHSQPTALQNWVYGLTEFHRNEIESASRIANPGCYAAAAILALGPLLEAGLIEPEGIHIQAASGVSGAGRASGQGFDFASANENLRAYSPTGHNHIPEIEQELGLLAGAPVLITFIPHLVPMTRGILVSAVAQASNGENTQALTDAIKARYEKEAFVRALDPNVLPETKQLTGTNFAETSVRKDERTGKVLAFAAIDNLGKGAAGQAIQNANLMFGFDESAGLAGSALIP